MQDKYFDNYEDNNEYGQQENFSGSCGSQNDSRPHQCGEFKPDPCVKTEVKYFKKVITWIPSGYKKCVTIKPFCPHD